jgi:uncharacterized membrane protein YfcA
MHLPSVIAILACAGFVQGLTGFGFGLVSMSLLPAIMDLRQAAALATFYGLLVTIGTFIRYYKDYNWRLGLPFLISMCVGVPVGVSFLHKSSDSLLIKTLGVFMIAFAIREFFFKVEPKSIHPTLSVPFGLFSGSLSGAFNLGGIPTATYAYAHPWTRGQIMAFLQTMLILSSTLRLLLYKNFGYLDGFSWNFVAIVALPLFGSMFLGHYVMGRISIKHMRRGIFAFIGLAGIYYLAWH